MSLERFELRGAVFGQGGSDRLTLKNVTITCNDQSGAATNGTAVGDSYITVIRADISACENGFDADREVTVRDSYVHDLYQSDAAHTDGLQSCCGDNLILEHSVWYGKTGGVNGTSAINVNALDSSSERSKNTLIQKNLLAGGAFAMYCPQTPTENYRVVDNVFTRAFDPKVAAYGPTTSCNTAGITFSGNVYENGSAVPADS